MSFDFDTIVEVLFETLLKLNGAAFRRLWYYGNFEQALIDELVVVIGVFFSKMEHIHLQCQKRQFELPGDECKGF